MVNLGSMSGLVVNRPQSADDYIARKAAVHMMTKALTCEKARTGIRLNTLAPSHVTTDMTLEMQARPNSSGPGWIRPRYDTAASQPKAVMGYEPDINRPDARQEDKRTGWLSQSFSGPRQAAFRER
jgi:NAD(P)-dependent dehydrogenase (short-subunit alcohol dehydrogenase family)